MPQRLISDTEFFDFKTNQYVQRLIASPVLNQGRRSSNSRSGLFEKILEMLDRHDLVEFVDKVNETHTEKIVWTPLTYTSDLANQISRLMDQQTREQSRIWLTVLMDKVSVPEPIGVSLFQQRLSQLESWLGLSHAQVELICFVFLYNRKHGLMETLSSFNAFNYESLYKNLPVVLGITEEESNELMSVDSVLARAGIVNGQRTFRTVEISETISEFLSGWRSGDIVDSMFDSITKPPYMELADFSLKPLQRDILLALLSQRDRSVNILLHGESGTGKTTLAACLGQHLGVPVFGIRSENQQDPQERMGQVALAATMFREQNEVALFFRTLIKLRLSRTRSATDSQWMNAS